MKPKDALKLASVLIFLDLALLMNYLWKGYLVAGIFFLRGTTANMITVMAITAASAVGFLVLRQNPLGYRPALWLAEALAGLSAVNIIVMLFYPRDISEFLRSLFGGDVLAGFAAFQALFLVNNLIFYALLKSSRSAFR